MDKQYFATLEYDPLWVSVPNRLKEAAQECRRDPRKFCADLLRGDPLQSRRKHYLQVGMSAAIFCWMLGTLVYVGIYFYRTPEIDNDVEESLQLIANLTPLQMPGLVKVSNHKDRSGGGGGGGNRENRPPSQGQLPFATLKNPIVAPSPHPPAIKNPSLPVVPTMQVQSDLVPKPVDDIPLGMPTGVPGPPSAGPGQGGGMGTGKYGGVGPGDGTGYGPGSGYNTGGGPPSIGGLGNEVYSIKDGASGPVILSKLTPKYTREAQLDKIQGTVVIRAIFRKDGVVDDIKVVRGIGYGLDEEAIKAAAQIRFLPGKKNGQPVNVRAQIEFTFTLL